MIRELFVGIDQSYTGFALVAWDRYAQNYQSFLKSWPKSKYGDGVGRLCSIRRWLEDTLADLGSTTNNDIQLVAMEGYSMGAKNGREQAGELGGVVKMVLFEQAQQTIIVAPTALKKFTTSRGNSAKQEMLLGVYKKWGFEFRDDNEADAFALSRLAEAFCYGATTKYEDEVLKKIAAQ